MDKSIILHGGLMGVNLVSFHKLISTMHCIFSLLHRACCRFTRLLYQLLHIYKIYKIYTLKH